jgi:Family of unknown function (DUF6677)
VTSKEDSPSFESAQSIVREEPQPTAPIPTAAAVAICSGAWLIPGLGHVLLGRWIRGLIFTACVIVMFVMGLAMNGKLYGTEFEIPLQIFALIANLGAGLPYLIAKYFGLGIGVMTSESYDYGTTFLWVAGLLNMLIVLDAFDIARGRKP